MTLRHSIILLCLLAAAQLLAHPQETAAAPPAASEQPAAAEPAPAAPAPASETKAAPAPKTEPAKAEPAKAKAEPAAAKAEPAPEPVGDANGKPELVGALRSYYAPELNLQDYQGGPIDLILLLKKIKRANPRELARLIISESIRGQVDLVIEKATLNRLLTWLVDNQYVSIDRDSGSRNVYILPYESHTSSSATPYFVPDLPLGDIITDQVDLVAQLRTWALDQKQRLAVDPALRGRAVTSLARPNMTINTFLDTLAALEVASAQKIGSFVYVQMPGSRKLWPNRIVYQPDKDNVEFNLIGMDIGSFAAEVRQTTGKTLLLDEGISQDQLISGHIEMLPFALGLQTLLESANLAYRIHQPDPKQPDAVYFVALAQRKQGVEFNDPNFDVYFESTPLNTVFQELSKVTHVPILLTEKLDKPVSIDLKNMPEQELLDLLLVDTGYRFLVGERAYVLQKVSARTDLVPFTKIRCDTVAKMLPDSIKTGLTVESLPSINSLLLSGPPESLAVLKSFVEKLDRSVPQVLLEVTMVEFTDTSDSNIDFNLLAGTQNLLGSAGTNIQLTAAPNQNGNIQIGRLPSNYTFNFTALESKGLAKVINKPLISAMSGEEAVLKIGETVYFMLTTEELVGVDNPRVRTTQRIESEEANFSLKIRPYVLGPDLLTVEVEPDFDSFTGVVTNNVPPNKSVTSLKSTVHLRNGETIVLGGLLKNTKSLSNAGVPLISRVPILGNLFKNRVAKKSYDETYFYIRPTIYYNEPDSVAYIRDPKALDPPIKEQKK